MSDTHLITALRHAAFMAAAQYDAYLFIGTVENGEHVFVSVADVTSEIALVENLPPVSTNGAYPTSSHVYRRAYVDKLRELQHDLNQPTAELYRQRYDVEGYYRALEMAFRNQGNSDTLLRALESSDYTWSMQAETQPESAVQVRFADGYRQGLQDAITLVEAAERPLAAYAPDWFEVDALPQLNQLLSTRQQYDAAQFAYDILQQCEGDMWRLERSIQRQQIRYQQAQQSGDQTMQAYISDVLLWLAKGQDIINHVSL
jgi:hypothetical protein